MRARSARAKWVRGGVRAGAEHVVRQLASIQPMAVTMDEQRLLGGLGLVLQRVGVPVYVHTINDPEQAMRYETRWGVSGLYTDTLAPLTAEMMGDVREAVGE